MSAVRDRPAVRTYGGWRRRRGLGLAGLDGRQSVLVLGAVFAVLIAGVFALRLALLLLVPAALAIGVGIVHWDGVWLVDSLTARVRWAVALRRGHLSLRGAGLVDHPQVWQLPGLLAPTRWLQADDGEGGTLGLVWDRRSGLLTATLRVAATGVLLADSGDGDAWVASWGAWLSALGAEPTVRWVSVTVDTAPDPGRSLRDYVEARLDPTAPATARAIMHDLVEVSPVPAASVETRVSVTFDPGAAPVKPGSLGEAATRVALTLRGLETSLAGCGLSLLGRYDADRLATTVRAAYDPAVRGRVDEVDWSDAGPVAAEERWESYSHDSGHSVSWTLREAPRQLVTSGVLTRLMAPGAWPRRVTLTYQAFTADQAAGVLEREVNAASFRSAYNRRTGREESARDRADLARAESAALEEAQGAGVVLFSSYVTTTVAHRDQLDAAVADVEQRAGAAKLRLRRAYGAQAATFAATLPCGIYLPFHAGRGRK